MEMSEDVQIIEDERQIIEISDDDSMCAEDIKDVILICNVAEGTVQRNNKSSTELSDGQKKTLKNVPKTDDKNSSSNVTLPAEKIINNTEIQYIYSEEEIAEPANSNICIVDHTENSQVNETNTVNQHGSLADKIFEAINNLSSNKTKSKSPNRRRKRRKKIRNRNKKKTVQNAITGNNVDVQEELNSTNEISQNKNTNSTAQEQEPSTPTCSTKKQSESYDFSKLKWLRPLNNLSSPPHLQIVIIDRSHPDWRITNDKWLMIEKRLLEALNSEMLRTNDPSIGLFDGAKWQRGIKIVGCQNENAFNYITKFIINLDKLWNGAKLDVFPISLITRHEVKVYIPPPTIKTELMLSLIKLQNPSICSKDWKVIKERERPNNGGVDIWISINDESFTQLCKLRGEIKYGINRVWVNPSR